MKFLCLSWIVLMWLFRRDLWKCFPQNIQLWSLILWLVSTWVNNKCFWWKFLLHTLHSKIFCSPWTIFMCCFLHWLVEKFCSHISHSNLLDESIFKFNKQLLKWFSAAIFYQRRFDFCVLFGKYLASVNSKYHVDIWKTLFWLIYKKDTYLKIQFGYFSKKL